MPTTIETETVIDQPCVVLCTCPNVDTAERVAAALLNQSLVACVNILPGITSMYRWQGELCKDTEAQLVIKTQSSQLTELEAVIRQQHPYDVPEIIAMPIQWGHQPYLDWIKQNC
ncbi:divalent-cation tolerance protein CutA [Ferrimonas lipolytica]|uniref:Divalent-cation tolerance protein CutA n=1 Tax=Ferrimonas lipolytica TaxID=2724191 RepID=A0A6H1ULE8_9GAMM|nr:divalent-cation tolerance protein CutA [Ferrimonas lipolytica]QIZ78622.1 divalent-cation tolerance protein CutA [Ferrimonas lipolytica]